MLELHDRIKVLRKDHLHLSQAAFGAKLGVNRDVINNIENNRLAKPEQKLSLIKLMCKEFSVSEEWLLNGTEPMFVQPDTFSLDRFVRERGGTDLEIEIVKAYFDLDKDARLAAVNYFIDRLTAAKAKVAEREQSAAAQAAVQVFAAGQGPDRPPDDLEGLTTEELEARYAEAQYKKRASGSA